MLMQNAKLKLNGAEYEFPVLVGTEDEVGIDFTKLRSTTGAITLDPGYANTGACTSTITFIDGERGILRYRGYPIEEVAKAGRFEEVCYLLIYGRLPSPSELDGFSDLLTHHTMVHEDLKNFFQNFPHNAHPMMILSAMVACLSAFYSSDESEIDLNIVRLLAKVKTIAAFSYKKSVGHPFVYPRNALSYTENFLHTMFAVPAEPYEVSPVLDKALNLLLILHADHEQNCSTSSVRMVGSSQSRQERSIQTDGIWPSGLQELRSEGEDSQGVG
jgi:citrate synthase